jgi:predicted HAD superfamily Cof-like phosphohydrolase
MNEDIFLKVKKFRQKLGLPISETPQLLEPQHLSFYARFLMEELSELLKAHEKQDLVDAADAIADLAYVTMGCAHHMGIPLPRILDIVHDCNMDKVPGTTSRGTQQDAMKPAGWVGPEEHIALILFEKNRK